MDAPGKKRYRVEDQKPFRGGQGVVYKAFDEKLKRDVALKVVLLPFREEPKYNKYFELEAKTMARLDHPNIVKVYDLLRTKFGKSGEAQNVIVMEWMDPENYPTLMEIIRRENPFDPELTIKVAGGVSNALDYAWSLGTVHGDLKPHNIFVGDIVKISDFTLSTWAYDREIEDVVAGTPHYMSPEAVVGRKLDIRSEVFSLTTILYEMVSGKKLFDGDTPIEIATRVLECKYRPFASFQSLSKLNHDMLLTIDRIFSKALQKNPDDRYQNATEFKDAIGESLKPYVPSLT
jgi:serine/threonine-protein kinase